jgi:hypothetical protein
MLLPHKLFIVWGVHGNSGCAMEVLNLSLLFLKALRRQQHVSCLENNITNPLRNHCARYLVPAFMTV